jgi:hypothetical protein
MRIAEWSGTIKILRLIIASINTLGLLPAQNRTFDLLTATVADVQSAVDSGALTYEQLIRLYLKRIEAYDKNGPHLNAVIRDESARGRNRTRA